MPSTKDRLQDDVKAALKAGDRARLGVLRMVMAAIKQREVDEDSGVLSILEKMIKQRQEAISQFERGGRGDLVAKETAEIDVIRTYLPEPLDEAAVVALIDAAIADTGAAAQSDMGRVMAEIKKNATGRVDMGQVSQLVRARLSAG